MPLKKKKQLAKKLVKKALKKKPVKKIIAKPKPKAKKAGTLRKAKENIVGKVTHYFPHVRAAVVKLKAPLSVGDTVKIKGHTTDFKQKVISMQMDLSPIQSAKKGQEIGLLVNSRVRQHDVVSKP